MTGYRKGLSLVELVIVFALIAVMMALSLPMLTTANAEARSAVCRQNLADMGGAIASHVQDTGTLPTLYGLAPNQNGMSLPEFIKPRLQMPNVVYCPSDETEESHLLGTSYRWTQALNGVQLSQLQPAALQPLLTDRESFHQDAGLLANELVLDRDDQGFLLTLNDTPREHPGQGNGHSPIRLKKGKPADHPGQGQPPDHAPPGNAFGRSNYYR
ncbi:MAG: pilus assembly FimT family protein [Phycisphaeraceae bacterium]